MLTGKRTSAPPPTSATTVKRLVTSGVTVLLACPDSSVRVVPFVSTAASSGSTDQLTEAPTTGPPRPSSRRTTKGSLGWVRSVTSRGAVTAWTTAAAGTSAGPVSTLKRTAWPTPWATASTTSSPLPVPSTARLLLVVPSAPVTVVAVLRAPPVPVTVQVTARPWTGWPPAVTASTRGAGVPPSETSWT